MDDSRRRSVGSTASVRRGWALVCGAVMLLGAVSAGRAAASPADGWPFGQFDGVVYDGAAFDVWGWVIDPDGGGPAAVHVYVDGVPVAALPADGARADVGAAFPAFGSGHGFAASLPAPAPGRHTVCVYGIDRGGAGGNVALGCRTAGRSPVGAVDEVGPRPGGVRVRGWAQDLDRPVSTAVHGYVDGVPVRAAVADRERPDVAAAYGNGSRHGFDVGLDVVPGTHQVCIYGIDASLDANALLGCRDVTLTGDPFGAVDELRRIENGVRLRGWAIDPDTTDPVLVMVYAFESGAGIPASRSRPDVGAAYPPYGADHGVEATVALNLEEAGANVCVVFTNAAGPGGDHWDCRIL